MTSMRYVVVFLICFELQAAVLPDSAQHALAKHASELRDVLMSWKTFAPKLVPEDPQKVIMPKWLPGYVIKGGIERVKNADRLRAVIRKYNLSYLAVPRKYLYHVPGTPSNISNDNYVVIAEKIKGRSGKGLKLNSTQVEQLYYASIYAPHYDMHYLNYIVRRDGKVVIIDTDDVAMPSSYRRCLVTFSWLFCGYTPDSSGDPAGRLERCVYYNNEASKLLRTKIQQRKRRNKLLQSAGTVTSCVAICVLIPTMVLYLK